MNIQNLKPITEKKRANGGARPGAGRKPNAATQLKEKLGDYAHEAMRAFQFCVTMMDDKTVEPNLRLSAAREVMDRLWGKPQQKLEHSGEVQGRIVLVRPGSI